MNVTQHIALPNSGYVGPVVTFVTGSKQWRLASAFTVYDDKADRLLTIDAGFEFDLASIPRAAWSLIAPFELSIVAPLFHDWLYRGGDPRYARAEADKLFYQLMRTERVSFWRRKLAYFAVRTFGASHWKGYK